MKEPNPTNSSIAARIFNQWLLGWRLLGRAILAACIFLFLLLPVGILIALLSYSALLSRDTPINLAILFGLILFVVVVYVPLVFGASASYMGFCPADLQIDHTRLAKLGLTTPWQWKLTARRAGLNLVFFAFIYLNVSGLSASPVDYFRAIVRNFGFAQPSELGKAGEPR